MMLNKLKDAASLAISVTTGKKPAFGVKERNLTNIIPGFGYAVMDEFENEFVDMESISKNKTDIESELFYKCIHLQTNKFSFGSLVHSLVPVFLFLKDINGKL